MNTDELRDVKLELAEGMDSEALQRVALDIDAAADAWEAERAHAAADVCMWRDCEERNADLRKRLEAAEYELATWKKAWADPYGTAKIIHAALAGEEPNVSV